MSGTSEFLPLEPSERVTEVGKKLCGTVTNVVRGTSEFYLIYLTLHYVARFVESNTLDLPRYPCDQTLEPRRALVLISA